MLEIVRPLDGLPINDALIISYATTLFNTPILSKIFEVSTISVQEYDAKGDSCSNPSTGLQFGEPSLINSRGGLLAHLTSSLGVCGFPVLPV